MVTITGHILFSSGSNLKGTAIICRDSSAVELENCKRIILDTLSAFTGICISEKDLTIRKVDFTGHLWARSTVTHQEGVTYKNWLFRTHLNVPENELPFPLVGPNVTELLIYNKELGLFYPD